jgi:hypothetical protein
LIKKNRLRKGELKLKFKTEVFLLTLSITLFVVSVIFYGYHLGSENLSVNWEAYPYRGYALAFVGFGSALMVTASLSYQKRGKNLLQ